MDDFKGFRATFGNGGMAYPLPSGKKPHSGAGKAPIVALKMVEPSEYDECLVFWQWLQLQPGIADHAFHICNEGRMSVGLGAQLKAIGRRRGLPDYCITLPRGRYHGLWIEMKRRSGGRLAPEQQVWLDRLNSAGYRAVCCHGADAAISVTRAYLGEEKHDTSNAV